MKREKALALYSDLLSDIATEVSQTCSMRNSVLDIYLGSSLPQLQLDLFKPILLENYAFLDFYLKDEEIGEQLRMDAQDVATSLELDARAFLHARVQEYAHTPDTTSLYTKFCIFILRNRANASSGETLQKVDRRKLSSNTPLTLQLSAQRMKEATGTV